MIKHRIITNTSSFWVNHFRLNLQKRRVNWSLKPQITHDEKAALLYSIQAWQLGETSDGKHLKAAATKYASKQNDPNYVKAIHLFIEEEQRHGENLGKYIDAIGEQRAKSDLGDSLFRMVRYFNTSMELWTITVIIVESAAQVFYQAVHDASDCQLLKEICSDILKDEAHHVKFQNERLHIILNRRGFYSRAFSVAWYCLLFFVTIHAVWLGHNRALKAGGVTRDIFMRKMYFKFFNTIRFIHQGEHSLKARTKLSII